jgi:hypothetical protein
MQILLIVLLLAGTSCARDPDRFAMCRKAIYQDRPHAYYEEHGLGDEITLAIDNCVAGAEPPEEYTRRVFKGSAVPQL